jgi:hypothetical protein
VSTWLNGTIQAQFRTIDGLSIRVAESEDRDDHALLLSPWSESLFAWWRPRSGVNGSGRRLLGDVTRRL